jgi:predicted nucleic acid-binding protein
MNSVVNSTVLSNFSAIGQLDLLHAVMGRLYLPIEIYDEIIAGQLAGYAFYDGIERHIVPLSATGWLELITLSAEELQLISSLPARLHRGEGACLCIARQRGWGFLTDDRAARQQAFEWGIPVSGTLGVLLLAVEDGRVTVDEGNALLRSMVQQARYHSPVTDLSVLLRR